MTFSERMKEVLEQGLDVTKDFASRASAKAQDIGERGMLMWDIKQLEIKAQKLLTKLGNETYTALIEKEQQTVDRDAAEFRKILEDIVNIKDQIEKKENELKNR